LACAVSEAALDVLVDEELVERSNELGEYFKSEREKIDTPLIREIRGRGLFIGVELTESARPYCEELKELGILYKETDDRVIRFAPTFVISEGDLDWALDKIEKVAKE